MKTTISSHSPSQSRSGFTLIELLIVIAIIAALALISFPAAALVMNQARKAQASAQVENLVAAIKQFDVAYGVLPLPEGSSEDDELETDSDFIDILTGYDQDGNVGSSRGYGPGARLWFHFNEGGSRNRGVHESTAFP